MAATVPAPAITGENSAIPRSLFNACFVLFVINASFFPAAYFSHWWIYDPNGLGIPTDFVNVWAAGRLVLEGHPALAWDWDIQRQIELALLRQDFPGYFAWHYPPPFLFVAAFLAQFPYTVAFMGWVFVSLVPYLAVMRAIVGRAFGLMLAVGVSDGAQQRAGRPERLSHRGADRRHALSDADAAGAVRHLPGAAELQAAIRIAVSAGADRGLAVDGPSSRAGIVAVVMAFALLARLRHRELAGLLPLDADVLAGLPLRGQGHLVEVAEPVRRWCAISAARTTGLDAAVDRDRVGRGGAGR